MGRASKRRQLKTKDFFFRFITPEGTRGIFHTEAQSPDQAFQKFLKFVVATGVEQQADNAQSQEVNG